MPLLTVHLENSGEPTAPSRDICRLHFESEIRTQDVAVKQTRVHLQDRLIYHGSIDVGAVASQDGNTGRYRMIKLDPLGDMYKDDYLPNIETGVSVVHCIMAGYRLRYTLGGDGYDPAAHKGIMREGIYYGKRNVNDLSFETNAPQFGFSHLESGTNGTSLPTDYFNTVTNQINQNYEHPHHIFEILDPPPMKLFNIPRTVYLEMPFSIKEEANGNVNGKGIIPCPVDDTKATTVTNLHCILLFEKMQTGLVKLSQLDGNIPTMNHSFGTRPLLLSNKYGGVKAIDLVLEYTTNNMHSSG